MKRIAALALIAALGASAAAAQDIKPVTSTQAPVLLGGLGATTGIVTLAVIATVVTVALTQNDAPGT